jgi:hypothetical protein
VGEQSLRVEHEHPRRRRLPGEARVDEALDDGARHARAAGARAVDDVDVVLDARAAQARGGEQPRERDRAGALDVVVEAREHVAVAREHVERGVLREVLPLHDGARVPLLHAGDERVGEREVRVAHDAALAQAEVERIFEERRPVRAHVEARRQGVVGREPPERVERELAYRDADTAVPLVANAQDRRRVGGDDHAHVVPGVAREDGVDAGDVARREREAPRGLEEAGVRLDRLADRGRVDDGHHLLDVPRQQRVEERLVAVLEGAQELVLRERGGELFVLGDHAAELLLEGALVRRQEPVEIEQLALRLGEGRAAVDGRAAQHVEPGNGDAELASSGGLHHVEGA